MTAIPYSELKKGVKIILDSELYEIIEAAPLFKGRGHSVLQAKLKNLATGNLISRTLHPSDILEEAEISKIEAKFLYSHRDKFFFSEAKNPAKRFDLTLEQIGEQGKFLKPNQTVEGIIFENKVINISLPIKINLKVIEAPPGLRGGRAEPGTKTVTLETGVKINVPLFIKEGDLIEINTQTGEYVRRVEEH
jgi:elongation factor P